MATLKKWIESEIIDGVGSVKIRSWRYFHDYIYSEMLDYREYIYRGHRCDNWLLEPTLDRGLKQKKKLNDKNIRRLHLKSFKYAVRGRRGSNPATLKSENDWWALGQHNSLATPLLDWTTSPFVGAFFAFEKTKEDDTTQRIIYAIHEDSIELKSKRTKNSAMKKKLQIPQTTNFFRPLSDENFRLVNQGGLFSRSPDGVDLESWIRNNFKGEDSYILMKIYIPAKDRISALRSLNRMNINHLSLFPDLYGASIFCNTDLQVDKY